MRVKRIGVGTVRTLPMALHPLLHPAVRTGTRVVKGAAGLAARARMGANFWRGP